MTARALIVVSVRPLFTRVQFVPQFVERKTPPEAPELGAVPAKILLLLKANERTSVLVRPLFICVQFIPLFDERKTPPSVPANIFDPLMARVLVVRFVIPVTCAQSVP